MRRSDNRPLVIPIFIPNQGCPHRCAFCNQSAVTGTQSNGFPTSDTIRDQTDHYLSFRGRRPKAELAFFGGNFLGLPKANILALLAEARSLAHAGKIDSVRFSTRPDTICPETLNLIQDFPVETIELGAQSMIDTLLERAGRGHTAGDTVNAVRMLKQKGYRIGLQMMVGLPGETRNTATESARRIAALEPDLVRIYPLIVLSGSRLHTWYREGTYTPMPLEACVDLVRDMVRLFRSHQIPIARMGLQATDLLQDPKVMVAGPWHPAFGHLVLSALFLEDTLDLLDRTDGISQARAITLSVHPSSACRLRGQRNQNLTVLSTRFPGKTIRILPDTSLEPDRIAVTLDSA